ncbi:MAG: 4-hydroxybenzoate octaprenyltransferase, partial [Burkholderiaceae bacterium]|nr:4-hydroxybenzoate octaprenyltransferase [Burkholderiaceae bacterium]
GMKTSAITLGRFDVAAVLAFYLGLVVIWGLALRAQGFGVGLFTALALVLVQVVWHALMIRGRTRDGCFRAFRLNHWIGLTLFAGIATDLLLRQ